MDSNTNLDQIKDALVIAGPFIKTLIDVYIKPKLISISEKVSFHIKLDSQSIEEHFSEYLHRTFKRVSIINTLVFKNTQTLLKDIYLPLTLIRNNQPKELFKISSFPTDLLSKYDKVMITDNAGMGKSTLIKKIFLEAIEEKKGIPILIELRRLNKDKSLIMEIREQLNSIKEDFNTKILFDLLNEGGFIFLFDGYDEINIGDRDIVTSDIQTFISKVDNNKFIITSRPENSLASFGDFQEFKIESLKKKEAFELIRKYDKNGTISNLLIKKLNSNTIDINEFLSNPLLVTLLFTAFEHKQTIPFKKHIFYRQVYDANFEAHDLTKGDSFIHEKHSKLAIDDFYRVLRHIGYTCLKESQRIEFSKDDILNIIRKAKLFCVGLNFQESDFLKDLVTTVPLFAQDGSYYRWAHKSLQEYFAAQFIYLDIKEKQKDILLQLYNSQRIEKYLNILDLYYDIDTKTFRNLILKSFLEDFSLHFNLAYKTKYKNVTIKDITLRKELTFYYNPFVFKMTQIDFEKQKYETKLNQMFNEMDIKALNLFARFGSLDGRRFKRLNIIFCFFITNTKQQILKLLENKLPNLFYQIPTIDKDNNLVEILDKEYSPYFINDNPNDPFNIQNNFHLTNELILNGRKHHSIIKSNEAINLLNQIEIENLAEQNEDFNIESL